MSADNWRECPKCEKRLKELNDKLFATGKKSFSEKEWDDFESFKSALEEKDNTSLREDYEFWYDDNDLLNMRYGSYCDICGFDANLDNIKDSSLKVDNKIQNALQIIQRFGSIDGSHHKTWVVDQVVRMLLGSSLEGEETPEYLEWVKNMKNGEDGCDTYDWDVGIAP